MTDTKTTIKIAMDITKDPKIVKLYYLIRREGVLMGLSRLPIYTKRKLHTLWVKDDTLVHNQREMLRKIDHIKNIYASVEFVNKDE